MANIGTIYLLDAIEIVCNSNNPIDLMLNLEKNVYKLIAKKYNKNEKTIKSDIIKATNKMNETKELKSSNKILLKYTPKMVINEIVDKLRN